MPLPLYQIDAFTRHVFGGNPAAVVPLQEWLPDAQLLQIAAENNLAETAFFVQQAGPMRLRWFTPTTEVDLCGHATLAAAHVLFHYLDHTDPQITFQTQSGELNVSREGELLVLDFPARMPAPAATPPALVKGLGVQPLEVLKARDYLVVLGSEEDVRCVTPDFTQLLQLDSLGVIITAPGNDCDFVSRFFAPKVGVPEDPVTGSAHSTLIPHWAKWLGKNTLHARQVSARGGELFCEYLGSRVLIKGHAVTYLTGTIHN